jgi:hypothetical protein
MYRIGRVTFGSTLAQVGRWTVPLPTGEAKPETES